MANLRNRASVSVTGVASSGLGDLTLGDAVPGFRSFADAYGAPSPYLANVSYVLTDGTQWETGYGNFNSSNTFGRVTVVASSNGGNKITASTSAILSSTVLAEDNATDWPVLVVGVNGAGRTIGFNAFTVVPFNTSAQVDTHKGWSSADNWYVVPQSGIYDCQGKFRWIDNTVASKSWGIGLDINNQDGPSFQWMATLPSQRQGGYNSRTVQLNAGDRLRMFIYADGSINATFVGAELVATRIR